MGINIEHSQTFKQNCSCYDFTNFLTLFLYAVLEQSIEFHERGKNHKQNVTAKIEEVS